jgi:hypothetical protein
MERAGGGLFVYFLSEDRKLLKGKRTEGMSDDQREEDSMYS